MRIGRHPPSRSRAASFSEPEEARFHHDPPLQLTAVERYAIELVAGTNPDLLEAFRKVTPTLQVIERENTGYGFFTSFTVDLTLLEGRWPVIFDDSVANVQVKAGDKLLDMHFRLVLDVGYSYLEGWAPDGDTDLKTINLGDLQVI